MTESIEDLLRQHARPSESDDSQAVTPDSDGTISA
jgi:hypothetical protein